jgi:hypothetical protein
MRWYWPASSPARCASAGMAACDCKRASTSTLAVPLGRAACRPGFGTIFGLPPTPAGTSTTSGLPATWWRSGSRVMQPALNMPGLRRSRSFPVRGCRCQALGLPIATAQPTCSRLRSCPPLGHFASRSRPLSQPIGLHGATDHLQLRRPDTGRGDAGGAGVWPRDGQRLSARRGVALWLVSCLLRRHGLLLPLARVAGFDLLLCRLLSDCFRGLVAHNRLPIAWKFTRLRHDSVLLRPW